MRQHGFLVSSSGRFNEPGRPGIRAVQFNQNHRRRLDDALVDIFHRAGASNNLDTTNDLLEVLEKWHRRRKVEYGRERRIGDAQIKVMRAELGRVTVLRVA
jgi:hypothetical protein